jgi:hypothetical protein
MLTVFWDITPCILALVHRYVGDTNLLHLQYRNVNLGNSGPFYCAPFQYSFIYGPYKWPSLSQNQHHLLGLLFYLEDGGNTFLKTFGILLPDYTK